MNSVAKNIQKLLRFLVLIKTVFILSESNAQTVGGITIPGKDTAQRYVSIYPIKITPHVYLSDRSLGLTFKRNSSAASKRIEYAPNQTLSIGIGASFGKLGLELGFKLPASDRQLKKYGRTRSLDLRLNSYGDKFGVDGYLQSYRGFYVRRGYERRTPDESVRPQFPQLRAFHLGGNFYYVFNYRRFSYRAVFTQTERQLRSAGSWLAMGSVSYLALRNQRSLIPEAVEGQFGAGTDLRRARLYSLAVMPGYGYTFIYDKIYLSGTAFAGLGVQQRWYILDDKIDSSPGVIRRVNFRLATGYFGDAWYGGINFIFDYYAFRIQNLNIAANTSSLKLFVGYRF